MALPPDVKKALTQHFGPRLEDLLVIADGIIEKFTKRKSKADKLTRFKTDFRDRVIIAQMLISMSMEGALAAMAQVQGAAAAPQGAPMGPRAPAPPGARAFSKPIPPGVVDNLRKAFLNKLLEMDVNFTNWSGAEKALVETDEGYQLLTALLPEAAGAAVKREQAKKK